MVNVFNEAHTTKLNSKLMFKQKLGEYEMSHSQLFLKYTIDIYTLQLHIMYSIATFIHSFFDAAL